MSDLPTLLWFNDTDGHWYKRLYASREQIEGTINVGSINLIGDVKVDGSVGLTGEKVLGGYKFTFKKGLLTGFAPV